MRTTMLWIGLLPCVAIAMKAQETPRVEVFAGYSYLRASDSISNSVNQHGWDLSVAANFSPSLGVVADFSNHYGTNPRTFTPLGSGGDGFTFLFGPKYAFRRVTRLTPFAHALFGGIRGSTFVPNLISDGQGGFVLGPACDTSVCYQSETAFATALGGGLDVKATDHFALRLAQIEYFRANLSRPPQNDVRISAGIVIRFGGR